MWDNIHRVFKPLYDFIHRVFKPLYDFIHRVFKPLYDLPSDGILIRARLNKRNFQSHKSQ